MVDKEILQKAVDNLVLSGGNKADAARRLGVPDSTFKDWVAKAADVGIVSQWLDPAAEQRIAMIRQEYEDTITELRRKVRDSARVAYTAEAWREFLWGLTDHKAKQPTWTLGENTKPGNPGNPTLVLSDFHWGEVVNPDQVGGINTYNTTIAKARLKTTIANTIDLCFNHMVQPNYEGLVLCLGGDMFSGDIHQELSASNEMHVMQILFDLFDNLVTAIDTLAGAFGRVFIVTAYGNHGRNTMKPMFKDAAFTNFDWVLYNMLDHHYRNQDKYDVKIKVTNAFDTLYTLGGINFLLTHGDRTGGGGGSGVAGLIPGIIKGIKKIKAQYVDMGQKVDYIIQGHWHQLLWVKSWGVVNGSLKGYDEFSMGHRFEPEAPMQALFFTHPTRGITFKIEVFCEETAKAEPTGEWVSVFENSVL